MEKELSEQENEFTLFIFNEDINEIIKITKSSQDSSLLVDGVTETVKHEIDKQEGIFLGALLALLAASIVEPPTQHATS